MARRRPIRRKRSRQQHSRKGLGWQAYALMVGAVIIVLGGIIFLNQREAPPITAAVSLDKSKGAEDAPVVVMEYGDFQ
jgi:hypothetical protein